MTIHPLDPHAQKPPVVSSFPPAAAALTAAELEAAVPPLQLAADRLGLALVSSGPGLPEALVDALSHNAAARDIHARLDRDGAVATAAELAGALYELIEAFPGGSDDTDLAGWSRLLSCDLREAAPSRFALIAGLKHLRRTRRSTFVPSIAEVLDAVAAKEALAARARRDIAALFDRIAKAEARLPSALVAGLRSSRTGSSAA